MSDIIWNYDDVHGNLLTVNRGKDAIGYFRIDRNEFVIITDQIDGPRIHIDVLKSIVNGYEEALREAKKMIEIE
tara:strand:+ start:1202 stop:1423 length:222 start_codon:yes stop_codon:yes gene_type:complete